MRYDGSDVQNLPRRSDSICVDFVSAALAAAASSAEAQVRAPGVGGSASRVSHWCDWRNGTADCAASARTGASGDGVRPRSGEVADRACEFAGGEGDVLDYATVESAMRRQDAVLSALGHKRFLYPNKIQSEGTRNILRDDGVRRATPDL